jgi:hypothetical protein
MVRQTQIELREEIGYRACRIEICWTSNVFLIIAHKVRLFVAYDLEWDPLELGDQEEIHVQTFTLDEALEATRLECRCDPEAA